MYHRDTAICKSLITTAADKRISTVFGGTASESGPPTACRRRQLGTLKNQRGLSQNLYSPGLHFPLQTPTNPWIIIHWISFTRFHRKMIFFGEIEWKGKMSFSCLMLEKPRPWFSWALFSSGILHISMTSSLDFINQVRRRGTVESPYQKRLPTPITHPFPHRTIHPSPPPAKRYLALPTA